MNRRNFLKAMGLGAAALWVEEPVRKLWFVSSNAPVGSRIETPAFDRWVARSFALKLQIAEEDETDRNQLLNQLWTRVRSQEDLDVLRRAANIVQTRFTGPDRDALMAEYTAGLRAQGRYMGVWRIENDLNYRDVPIVPLRVVRA